MEHICLAMSLGAMCHCQMYGTVCTDRAVCTVCTDRTAEYLQIVWYVLTQVHMWAGTQYLVFDTEYTTCIQILTGIMIFVKTVIFENKTCFVKKRLRQA